MSFSTISSEVFPSAGLARCVAKSQLLVAMSIRVAVGAWSRRQRALVPPLTLAVISLLLVGVTMTLVNDFAAAMRLMPDNLLGGIDPVSLDSLVRRPVV